MGIGALTRHTLGTLGIGALTLDICTHTGNRSTARGHTWHTGNRSTYTGHTCTHTGNGSTARGHTWHARNRSTTTGHTCTNTGSRSTWHAGNESTATGHTCTHFGNTSTGHPGYTYTGQRWPDDFVVEIGGEFRDDSRLDCPEKRISVVGWSRIFFKVFTHTLRLAGRDLNTQRRSDARHYNLDVVVQLLNSSSRQMKSVP